MLRSILSAILLASTLTAAHPKNEKSLHFDRRSGNETQEQCPDPMIVIVQYQLITIINEVEYYLNTTLPTPDFLQPTLFSVQSTTWEPQPTGAVLSSLSSLWSKATPLWSSLQSQKGISTPLPSCLSSTPAASVTLPSDRSYPPGSASFTTTLAQSVSTIAAASEGAATTVYYTDTVAPVYASSGGSYVTVTASSDNALTTLPASGESQPPTVTSSISIAPVIIAPTETNSQASIGPWSGYWNTSSSFSSASGYPTASSSIPSSPTGTTNSTGNSTGNSTPPHNNSTTNACSGNTPTTRSQWCQYDINTNYYDTAPDTGVVREYWWNVEVGTLAPDGVSRYVQTINGSFPGPTIYGDWGDTIVVHVTNSIPNNGTSIHFHGVRQNGTNPQDGVPSLTQCPVAPGSTHTYTWKATQYGSSWWHSHWGLQAWEGVQGAIIINGPATANYDEDKGALFLNDWSHQTMDALYIKSQSTGVATLETGLINGTNVWNATGKRFETVVKPGTSYRLRIVNSAIDTHWKFSIDNHSMTVIASDFVPIVPYTTNVLNLAVAQRYDVIVTADQGSVASDFWIRAIPQQTCSDTDNVDNIRGILHYGNSTGTPLTVGYPYTDECVDEPFDQLVPFFPLTVGSSTYDPTEEITVGRNSDNLYNWYLNNSTFVSPWSDPTLLQVVNGNTNFTAEQNVIEAPNANEWVYVAIYSELPVSHPIHLHGHDFFVVAQGNTSYSSDVALKLDNPPRRDVALLPAAGYLVLAFNTNNPGAWLMHCHIGWHTGEGLDLQIVERRSEMPALLGNSTDLQDTCNTWNAFTEANNFVQTDSGV